MVTPDSTGVERRRARLDGNHPRTHPSEKSRRKLIRKSISSTAIQSSRTLAAKGPQP
jgi:hypothetical protein